MAGAAAGLCDSRTSLIREVWRLWDQYEEMGQGLQLAGFMKQLDL